MNQHGFPCPKCGSAGIRRSRRQSFLEIPKRFVGIYAFRCLKCSERFFGNVWILSTGGHTKCPRCLRLDVMPSLRMDIEYTRVQKMTMALGAQMYRCVPCRLNFVSFRKCIHQTEQRVAVDGPQRAQ